MSEITCIVCKGTYFREGYYTIDSYIEIHSTAINDKDTLIDNEVSSNINVDFKLVSEEKDKKKIFMQSDEDVEVFRYNCENCGYIMSFTTEKNVESSSEAKKRKQKENSYDWSNFK